MSEKKHYRNGIPIALTFPLSPEQIEQGKLNKEVSEQLELQKKQNKEQAELLDRLRKMVDKKGKK